MVYLLFNNDILISDGKSVKKSGKGHGLDKILDPLANVRLCYVDVDVLIASAPENYPDKKDNILADKFTEIYPDEYITMSEKIDSNVFQVFGIKAQKVKEIYSLIESPRIDAFVPYALVIRDYLVRSQVDMNRMVVFVDDLGNEKLITVFDGLKFSRTRTVSALSTEDILPEIKRSYIDFNKKIGEFSNKPASRGLVVITNDPKLQKEAKILDPDLSMECLECRYPGLEGLALIVSPLKYRVPEEIIQERKKLELRSTVMHLMVSVLILLAGVLFFGFCHSTYSSAAGNLEEARSRNAQLNETLDSLDRYIYRDALKMAKNINYSSCYYDILELLPATYAMSSFKFSENDGKWTFDSRLFVQDDQFYEAIPKIKILKNAQINDLYFNGHPGKHLKVVL